MLDEQKGWSLLLPARVQEISFPKEDPYICNMPTEHNLFPDSKTPLYEQVVRFIKSDIQQGIYKKGERIASVNEASAEYQVARDTVEKAYKILKEEGIIESVPGKGYFVAHTDLSNLFRVCLLFNKMGPYKKETYESFIKVLGEKALVDLYIYHYNLKVFERIIDQNLPLYDYFVIVPHFHPGTVGVAQVIQKIPREKVLIIDKQVSQLSKDYPAVYQDFEADIMDGLTEALPLLKKYQRLILVYRLERMFSIEIRNGFSQFCKTHFLPCRVIDRIEEEDPANGDVFVVISDEDLVVLIKKIREKNMIPGKDLGIISYNENPVKEILEGGITTISTQHYALGEMAARMLLSGSKEKIKIPFQFVARKSL